jgi:hypothetical protein
MCVVSVHKNRNENESKKNEKSHHVLKKTGAPKTPAICTLNVLQGAASKLRPSGLLLIYGPFAIDGEPQGEGNIKFDASLRSKNDEWGYRDRDVVFQEGERFGLERVAAEAMPADNHFLIMRRPSL